MKFNLQIIIYLTILLGYSPDFIHLNTRNAQNNLPQKNCSQNLSIEDKNPSLINLNHLPNPNRNVEIPINYHKIFVEGDLINIQVTVDNQNTEHAIWDIRDYSNNTFLLYPGYIFDYPGHSYSVEHVLPPGEYALFIYDDFGTGGVSATVSSNDGTTLASINQGQWQYFIFLEFTVTEGNFTEGLISDELIETQTEVLNNKFNPLGYSFTIESIDSASNAGWYYATDSHKFETGQWENEDQYLIMAQEMAINPATSINFYWTGAYFTSGLGVYPWSFEENDSRHGLFCSNFTHPGSIGTFSEGYTAVHEVGHYFGLYHTFENGCINPGDEVDDTPTQYEPNYGCPQSNHSCGSFDDIGNFMDYSDDICLNHFTPGQISRMEWALSTYRPTLISQNLIGNLNSDNIVNILDVIVLVNIILGTNNATESQQNLGDLNNDELLNISDVILLIYLIIDS